MFDVDEVLAQWDSVKKISCPRGDSTSEVIEHEERKNKITYIVDQLQLSKLTNNLSEEQQYSNILVEEYNTFVETFAYQILKNTI